MITQCGCLGLDDPLAFHNGIDAVDAGHGDFLFCSARPANLDFVHFRGGSQAEMEALVRTRRVAAATKDIGSLANAACR